MTTLTLLEHRKAELEQTIALHQKVADLERKLMLGKKFDAMRSIAKVVCDHFGVGIVSLQVRTRTQPGCFIRQTIMHLIRKLTSYSLIEIGELFQVDHGTVMHACKTVQARIDTDRKFRADVATMERKCMGKG